MLTSGLSLRNQKIVNKRGHLSFRIVNVLKFLDQLCILNFYLSAAVMEDHITSVAAFSLSIKT